MQNLYFGLQTVWAWPGGEIQCTLALPGDLAWLASRYYIQIGVFQCLGGACPDLKKGLCPFQANHAVLSPSLQLGGNRRDGLPHVPFPLGIL